MRIEKGDYLQGVSKASTNDVFVSTTNAVVRRGKLVMGAGSALAMAKLVPSVPMNAGNMVVSLQKDGVYGFTFVYASPINSVPYRLGIFQTKKQFTDPASLNIILKSTEGLAAAGRMHRDSVFHVAFPGIGLGQLAREDVEPILKICPDNVVFYIKD